MEANYYYIIYKYIPLIAFIYDFNQLYFNKEDRERATGMF